MEEQAKPRVNGATIAKFIGKRVTIVGRYISVSISVLQLECLRNVMI